MRIAERAESGWATVWIMVLVVYGLVCVGIASSRQSARERLHVAAMVFRLQPMTPGGVLI
jgi:hypothetical protein